MHSQGHQELLRCLVDHAHLPVASQPAPRTQQAAVGKAQTQQGSSKKKAKQLGSPSAVGQKASAHLQLAAAVAVPNEPVHMYSDGAVCNAGDPLASTPHVGNAGGYANVCSAEYANTSAGTAS